MRPLSALLTLVTLLGSGCVRAPRIGVFQDSAFYSTRDHYRVRYAETDVERRSVLGPDWSLQPEYALDADGRPRTRTLGRFERVASAGDFSYTHRRDGSEVYARTLPLEEGMGERDLQYVVDDVVSAITDRQFRDRTTVITILDRGPATVGGAEAYRVVFETFQQSTTIDARTPGIRAYVVLMRATPWMWRRDAEQLSTTGDPMLVVLSLVGRGEAFASHVGEFEALLDRVDLHPAP